MVILPVRRALRQPLQRDPTQGERVQRVLQGAVPDLEYTDSSDGKQKMVELKFIKQCPLRYGVVATSLRAGVNKREQQLYQEYLTRLQR